MKHCNKYQREIKTKLRNEDSRRYKTDKKQFYKYVRNKTKSQTGVGTVLDIKGNFTTSDKDN